MAMTFKNVTFIFCPTKVDDKEFTKNVNGLLDSINAE